MRSDAFIWPFDGDPLNCCQAARLSRRGWESQVVAGGWLGRARRGEGARAGDARGGKGLPLPFSLPSLRLGGRGYVKITPAMCMQHPRLARRRGDSGSTRVRVRARAMCSAETRSGCIREGVGELQWEEGGKGECRTNVEHVAWACGSGRCGGTLLTRRQ